MTVTIVSIFAVIFTIARSWPQFLKIVVKGERSGVSVSTWLIALVAHTSWCAYGVLSPVLLFIPVNILAGAGCAATAWALGARWQVFAAIAGGTGVSLIAFSISDPTLLTVIVMLSIAMFIPQMIKVFRSSPQGLSLATWVIAVLASSTWIFWAFLIGRPNVASAHYFMLTVSLIIVIRKILSDVSTKSLTSLTENSR